MGRKPDISPKDCERVQHEYELAISHQYKDPKACLITARRVAEDICTQLVDVEMPPHPSQKPGFGRLIGLSRKQQIFPQPIYAALEAVRNYGNIGAHPQGEDTDYITPDYAKSCLFSLATIFDWYVAAYHPTQTRTITRKQGSHIFISYCHQKPDSLVAQAFANALNQAGHQAFIDNQIRWGNNWVTEIRAALKQSEYLLLLLAPETLQSEMVLEEIRIANELARLHNGVPILLPVRIRLSLNEALPYPLENRLAAIPQEIWENETDMPRLIEALLCAVEERTGWPGKTPPAATQAITPSPEPQPQSDPRKLLTYPGGAISVDAPMYVEREADGSVLHALKQSRAIVTVRGARQTGKTSLVMRVYAAMQEQIRVAFVDFQPLPHEAIESLDMLWRAITLRLASQLHIRDWTPVYWNDGVEYTENLAHFFDAHVFQQNKLPVLLCFDELERVFSTPVKSGFFASVRSLYNSGALDPVWGNVRWLLVTSSEPSFFIRDLRQSPFNVGMQVELEPFTAPQVATFAQQHGLTLSSRDLAEIMEYIGGHPYLTHVLLYHLARDPDARDRLFDVHTAGCEVFKSHLHRYLVQFQQEPALAEAMAGVIKGQGCKDARIANRLEAAGLVRRDHQWEVVPLCRLYAEFFERELG